MPFKTKIIWSVDIAGFTKSAQLKSLLLEW